MSLASFLTGVTSLFSGGDKTRTTSEGQETMTGEQAVVGDSTSTSSNTTKNNTNSTTKESSNTKGYTKTSTWGKTLTDTQTNTTGQSATDKSGLQQNLSDETYAGLEGLLADAFGSGATQQAQGAIQDRLATIQNAGKREFNVEGFVNGISQSAAAQTQLNLEERINSMLSDTGGSETSNSMAALLGNRVRNDAAANFAGIASEAYATGENIRMAGQESVTNQLTQLSGDIAGNLASLLDASKGAISAYRDSENTKYSEQQNQAQQTHYNEGSVTNTNNTTNTTSNTKTNTTQTSQDKTKTTETGLTQVKSDKNTKDKTKTKKGDLFTNLVNNLSKTKAVASKPKVAAKPKTTAKTQQKSALSTLWD